MRLWFAVCLVAAAAPVFASPRVAVHPLVVSGGDERAADESRTDFIGEAARQQIQMVSRGQVAEVLAAQPGGGCKPDGNSCLELLGRETGAPYALLATLMLDGPSFVLGAKVVAANGTVMESVENLTIEKNLFSPRAPQVQAAFKKLFGQLKLGGLPEQAPETVAVPEPKKETQPNKVAPEVVVVTPEERGGAIPASRVGGLVVGGLAIVAAGVGTGFAVMAMSDGAALKPRLSPATNAIQCPATGPCEDLRIATGIDTKSTVATGMFVVAGVAAAASVTMLVLSAGSDSSVAITPVEGGAMLGLAGSF